MVQVNLYKPLVLRKINNYLNNLGAPVSYNTLDDVPIDRIYFTSEGNYRCFDGSSANSTGDFNLHKKLIKN